MALKLGTFYNLEMIKKKTPTALHFTWRTTAQEHFKIIKERLAPLKQTIIKK